MGTGLVCFRLLRHELAHGPPRPGIRRVSGVPRVLLVRRRQVLPRNDSPVRLSCEPLLQRGIPCGEDAEAGVGTGFDGTLRHSTRRVERSSMSILRRYFLQSMPAPLLMTAQSARAAEPNLLILSTTEAEAIR